MVNKIKRKILWLRISYWTGAILDGLYIIPMLFPEIGGNIFGLNDFRPDAPFRYAMAVGAALMLGWTALLIWADRKPLERREILLLTIFPVKVCLDLASIILVVNNVISIQNMLLSKIDAVLYYILIIYSYLNTNDLTITKENEQIILREK